MSFIPLLGFITEADRTVAQHAAHAQAIGHRLSFALPTKTLAQGEKFILTDFLKHPEVIADIGYEFNGFWQLTGSCPGASIGNNIVTLSAVQRCIADDPTKAFVPWWPFNYGRARFKEGDRGQGEGAVVSVVLEEIKEGCFAENQDGLPKDLPDFKRTSDGVCLTEDVEMQWSDGSKIPAEYVTLANRFPIGSVTAISDCDQMETAILNGYMPNNGCDMFIEHGEQKGSGNDACVIGKYTGRGGHATNFIAVWHHPQFGRLFGYWNQWPTSVYPKDPFLPRCAVWVPESEVDRAFNRLGMKGECGAPSHLNYMLAQPTVIDWTKN